MRVKPTMPEWTTTAEAIDMLDAPYRDPPSLIDNARAPFSVGLLLVPLLLVIAGIGGLVHAVITAFTLPAW